jgi:hypothetical protein
MAENFPALETKNDSYADVMIAFQRESNNFNRAMRGYRGDKGHVFLAIERHDQIIDGLYRALELALSDPAAATEYVSKLRTDRLFAPLLEKAGVEVINHDGRQ